LEELFAIADRVTTLRDGTYIGTREMASVTTAELIKMMVGRDLDELFPKMDVEPGAVVLEVENLTIPNKFANVSFSLHAGEILGMSGLVGAGRTEVAQAIFGVDTLQSGTIKVDGAVVSIPNPSTAMQIGIGYVPEDRKQHGLVLEMPITDNITLPSLDEFTTYGWLNEKAARVSAEKSATQFEIKASSVNQLTGQLSGGNQQKVVLAKWLARQPRILILDEPTRGIDVGTKATVHHLMGSLAAQGMAILMISSELPEILGMSDRILVMREGQLIREFSRAEATQEKLMMAATGTVDNLAE
jgi:ABC-type sugar transport system ATPase subunit